MALKQFLYLLLPNSRQRRNMKFLGMVQNNIYEYSVFIEKN